MADSSDLDHASSHSLHYTEIHCMQQLNVTKLSRAELEDLYYQLHDENIHIKKNLNNLENKYKVMSTRVMRLSRDQKGIDSPCREEEQKQLRQLRQNEAGLRAKLTVLRGQLASHTRLHLSALSKPQRSRGQRCNRGCRERHCSSTCGGEDGTDLQLDSSRVSNQRNQSTSRSGSWTGGRVSEQGQEDTELQKQVADLKERISVLQKDMQVASDQSRQRINELETELATRLSSETAENIELIRSRRANKQQEAAIATLQQDIQCLQRELQAAKGALALAARDQDEICTTLARERQRSADLQEQVVQLNRDCTTLRDLQEHLNEVKKENIVLKEHSNQLLQLTTGMSDSVRGAGEGERVETNTPITQHLTRETSLAREQNAHLERQLTNLKEEQNLLQQKLRDAQNELSLLQTQLSDANKERAQLQHELTKVRNDCLGLQKELLKPNEDLNKLTQELTEVRNECSRLQKEISQGKMDLQHQQQQQLMWQQQQAHEDPQEQCVNKIPSTWQPPFFKAQSHPVFSTRQVSVRPFLSRGSVMRTQSQPVTPRPVGGDAYLALLEQTAIRSPLTSFSAKLGVHGTLQERYLELCLPSSSPRATSTPVPPSEQIVAAEAEPADISQVSDGLEEQPCLRTEYKSPRSEANTQWELERCRELLRVQCNLNSIYKKEVASLNHIVKTLTTQDAKR